MSTRWLIAGALLRCCLLLYSSWQDRQFELNYTDIDYYVYTDAAAYVVEGKSPYDRATYRYSPLIAWILIPNALLFGLWGKVLFCIFDLLVAWLMDSLCKTSQRTDGVAAMLWLFNPFTFTISTRGSCDSITVFGILALITLLERRRYFWAGVQWAMCVHWRLFPLIYTPAIISYLTTQNSSAKQQPQGWMRRFLSKEMVGFGLGASLCLTTLGAAFYTLYEDEYVDNAILYHLRRIDPRHNFSIHFYPLYLTHWRIQDYSSTAVSALIEEIDLGRISTVAQMVLLLSIAFKHGADLPLSFSLSTITFVAFNKVCTAQYFVWYFGLLPILIDRLPLQGQTQLGISLALWIIAEGHWLFWAYLLEFKVQTLSTETKSKAFVE